MRDDARGNGFREVVVPSIGIDHRQIILPVSGS